MTIPSTLVSGSFGPKARAQALQHWRLGRAARLGRRQRAPLEIAEAGGPPAGWAAGRELPEALPAPSSRPGLQAHGRLRGAAGPDEGAGEGGLHIY